MLDFRSPRAFAEKVILYSGWRGGIQAPLQAAGEVFKALTNGLITKEPVLPTAEDLYYMELTLPVVEDLAAKGRCVSCRVEAHQEDRVMCHRCELGWQTVQQFRSLEGARKEADLREQMRKDGAAIPMFGEHGEKPS